MESPLQETIYGTNSDDNHVMSEKVQSLASNIYRELERMIEKYDEDVVKELMPLVVNVLESLDSAVMDNQEHEVEIELLRDDNEQLVTQYEREKQLRKTAEQRLLEIEYSTDDDRRNLLAKVESLESIVRMLELKAKNSSDHASRLEEKDSEMKKEYATLHERYTELFKTHMDYMERTKILFGSEKLDNLNNKTSKTVHYPHHKTELTSFVSPQEVNAKILSSPTDVPDLISPNQSSDSNASLKSELQEAMYTSIGTSPRRKSGSKKSVTERGQITDQVTLSDRSTGTRDGWVDDLDSHLNDATITTPEMDEVEELDGFSFGLGSDVKNEHRRANTLYQELSFQDNDALGEMDEGADISGAGGFGHSGGYSSSAESEGESEREPRVNDNFFGMGKEVEILISENNELLATKNALNVVKDDLIAKVDELTSEQEILREELKQYMSVKEKLKHRVTDLEDELRRVKEASEKKSGKSDDEEELPMAQRKRFTRVEMARVLMERNQYKERLMELQEAVRWTEMIRASRSDSSLDTKRNKSSIWKFFSNLFNASEKPARKTASPYVNVHYSAPTTNTGSALDTMRKKRLGDRHRGLDMIDSDMVSEKLQQQRARERREQYKQVRAHVRKEDGRLQAYGWSLPSRTAPISKSSEAECGAQIKPQTSSVPVPVPVFCRPLLENETGMKVWCAAGVDLSGGKYDAGEADVSAVGSSMFYVSTPEETDAVAKLNTELREYERHRKEQSEMEKNLSSLVWLCTSTHTTSKVTVIDANNPAEIIVSFHVCCSHLLCIASVPGSKLTDYRTDEEFLSLGQKESKSDSKESEPGKVGDLFSISVSPESGFDSSASTPVNNEDVPNDFGQPENLSAADSNRNEEQANNNEPEKMSTIYPTMWMGSQDGYIYIHSSVQQWWQRIGSVKLRDSVLSIMHYRGRVFAGLADGSVAIFHRASDGEWDLLNYHLLDLGRPLYSVRCMAVVDKHVWCGHRNCIHVIDTETLEIVQSFDAHPRKESQVRQMAWIGDGVWITIRLDSTLRLYHAQTRQHLQDVDIEPYVSKMLGTGKLGFSFVRITALLVSCKRLWMGTGNGVIISVPLLEDKSNRTSSDMSGRTPGTVVRVYSDQPPLADPASKGTSFIPYCSMAQAQLSFHGHRDAVKFFVAVPGHATANKMSSDAASEKDLQTELKRFGQRDKQDKGKPDCMLILSGGEGYIDFRIGDGEEEETMSSLSLDSEDRHPIATSKGDRSHLIVWQVAITD